MPAMAGIPTDGDSLVVGDTLLTVCPWWDGPVGRAAVAAQLAGRRRPSPAALDLGLPLAAARLHHLLDRQRDYGDADLRAGSTSYRPDMVLAGHVHQSPFKPDGSWADRIGGHLGLQRRPPDRPVPAHIEIDLGGGWARWSSMLGAEEIDLGRGRVPERTVF